MAPHIPASVHFIPGHPVAGTEDSRPDWGFAELFINRWCILTPSKDANQAAVERLVQFWKVFGASVEIMSPEHHDLVLAVTSHVPHLIAYNIVGTAFDLRHVTESKSSNIPPAVFAISPALRRPTRPCGATFS